jgi:predicted DNA-binding protein (UPF0251 family)
MPDKNRPPAVRKHTTRSACEYRLTRTNPFTGEKKHQSVYQSSLKELELIKAARYFSMSGRGYQVVAEQMGIARQTTAMPIACARKHGSLPPLDGPHRKLWSFVVAGFEHWEKDSGTER